MSRDEQQWLHTYMIVKSLSWSVSTFASAAVSESWLQHSSNPWMKRPGIVCASLLPAASTGPQAFAVSNEIPILAAGNKESQSHSTYTTRKRTISGSFMNHSVGTSENTYKKHMLSMDGNRLVQIGKLEQCSCTIASCVKSEHMWVTANRVKSLLVPLENSCQQSWINTA